MIRKLAGYVGEYKKYAILAPILIMVEVIMETIIPMVMASLIDKGITAGNMGYTIRIGIFMCFLILLSLGGGFFSGYTASIASTGFAKNLRKAIYERLQTFSFSNIDKFSTSSLITRCTTDVTNVQNSFQMLIRICIRAPFMLIMAFIMAFRISGSLSLIFLVAIPFLGIMLWYVMTHAHPNFRAMFKRYDLVNQIMQEDLAGIRTVKAFVREDHEDKRFREATDQLVDYSRRAEKIIILNNPAMQFTIYACMLALSWFGAHQVISETLTTGQLSSLFTYVMQILSSLMMISMVMTMVSMSATSAQRIVEVLDETADLANCENPVMEVKDGSISFKHAYFSYDKNMDNCVLEDLDFDIKSGETIGILGATGSGKTSLVNLISRLYDVTSGSIEVGGEDVRNIDMKELRDQVSVVLQKNVLFSGSIYDNIRWGDKTASDEEVVRVCKLAQADGFINEFPDGYNTHIERGGTNVSGGQKQRLCIARALLKKPKILILDDSTSAVDTKTDALIRKAFREEIPNTTKIIIAQRISSIEDADRVLILDNGKVNAFDTPANLLASNEIYQDVYSQQVKGGRK